jgi:hypothetical protein
MGRLLLACLIVCAASGCIDWGSLYQEQDGGSADSDSTENGDGPPTDPVGCSDGTAEALLAERGLAACAGAWSVPGVVGEREPTCDRAAGNEGGSTTGENCSVADLCAVGWHVCRDSSEVALHGGDAACEELGPPSPDGGEAVIYITGQRGVGDAATCAPEEDPEAADDVWGCGTLGLETTDCRPLDRHLALVDEGDGCGEPFECGDDPRAEGLNVTKREPAQGGGVLCCSDIDP